MCERPVAKNQKLLACEVCRELTHAHCSNSNIDLTFFSSSIPTTWTCPCCAFTALPFRHADFSDSAIPDSDLPGTDAIDSLQFANEHLSTLQERSNQLKVLHINTQSMVSTFDELLVTMNEYPFDVVTMSETWLKNNPHLLSYVNIPGYCSIFWNRDRVRGGGVGAYVREGISFKRRFNIENIESDLEHLWIEIQGRNKHNKMLLGVVYRSERILDFQTWLDRAENLFSQLSVLWDGLLVINGDMNVDMLKPENPETRKYNDMLESMNLYQHMTRPTRATLKSRTLIDHIVSNIPNRVTYCSVLPCSTISDHDGPYACTNIRVNRFQPRFKWLRNEKQSDKQAFNEDLKATPFNLVYSVEDPDEKLEIFNSLLRTCVDKHAPLWKTKITRPPAPWLHKENIRKLQRERDQLRYLAHQTN